MQQRHLQQLFRGINMPVQAQKGLAAYRHHFAGNQLFALIAHPVTVAKADRHIGSVAEIVAVVSINHVDFGMRVRVHERRQAGNKPAHAKQRDQADRHLLGLHLIDQMFGRLAQHVKRRADRAIILPPLLAESQPPPLPFGERDLQIALQHLKLMTDRRRRYRQLLRRPGHAAQACDRLEGAHRPQRRIVGQRTLRPANRRF